LVGGHRPSVDLEAEASVISHLELLDLTVELERELEVWAYCSR
jgi:hypothetical protein